MEASPQETVAREVHRKSRPWEAVDENANADDGADGTEEIATRKASDEYFVLKKYNQRSKGMSTKTGEPESSSRSAAPNDERSHRIGERRFFFREKKKFDDEARIEQGEYFDVLYNATIKITGPAEGVHIIESFEEMKLNPNVRKNLSNMRFLKPLPVQRAVFSLVSAGYDAVTYAPTGSGKTAAFLIPIIDCIVQKKASGGLFRTGGVTAIVISPVRELSLQHFEVAREIAHGTSCKLVVSVGDMPVQQGVRQIGSGCDVFFGTVGRFLHYLATGTIRCDNLKYVVLDEADKLLDGDFFEELSRGFLKQLKENVQRLLFSATATFTLEDQNQNAVLRPCASSVQIGNLNSVHSFIEQIVYRMTERDKATALIRIMRGEYQSNAAKASSVKPKTIVFVNTKRRSAVIACYLSLHGFKAYPTHGNLTTQLRAEGVKAFERGDCDVLVCTDVLSRGLDLKDVRLVINYDVPMVENWQVYVHRVGRTGRLGNTGRSITFYCPDKDSSMAGVLYQWLRVNNQDVPDYLVSDAKRQEMENQKLQGRVTEEFQKAMEERNTQSQSAQLSNAEERGIIDSGSDSD